MAGKKLFILVAPTGNQKDVPGSHVPVTPDEIATPAEAWEILGGPQRVQTA